jgi:hypothetical protein
MNLTDKEIKDSGNHSYEERNKCVNTAERIFEDYCFVKAYFIQRLGFDEKNNPVPNFFNLNPYIRNLPDYFICNPHGKDQPCSLIMVKGTANIKFQEYQSIPLYMEWYESPRCPILYAFCFKDQDPIFMKPKKVIELYENSSDKVWPDGKVYRNIKIN